jgi:uncharacterized membrane protein YphA (DoxX/SURF4 family)
MMRSLRALVSRPAVVRVAQLAIGVVFVAAGLAKIGNLSAFAAQVHNFRLLPVWSENLVAITLPWIEVVAGLALVAASRAVDRRAGAWVAAVLMVLFTAGVAQAWLRGLDIECGCFGTGDASRVGLQKLLENVGLTALALVALGGQAAAASVPLAHADDDEAGSDPLLTPLRRR